VTLNGPNTVTAHYLHKTAAFGANCVRVTEAKPILSFVSDKNVA